MENYSFDLSSVFAINTKSLDEIQKDVDASIAKLSEVDPTKEAESLDHLDDLGKAAGDILRQADNRDVVDLFLSDPKGGSLDTGLSNLLAEAPKAADDGSGSALKESTTDSSLGKPADVTLDMSGSIAPPALTDTSMDKSGTSPKDAAPKDSDADATKDGAPKDAPAADDGTAKDSAPKDATGAEAFVDHGGAISTAPSLESLVISAMWVQ